MTTTLITGANKGLGFETARRLVAAGHIVYVGARDAERGRRAADELGARFVRLDVTDDASVQAAAKTIEADGGLDVLVNNAGIEVRGEGNSVAGAADVTAEQMRTVLDTNVLGIVRVTHAFLPLLRRSAAPACTPSRKAPRSSCAWPSWAPTVRPAAASTPRARCPGEAAAARTARRQPSFTACAVAVSRAP